MQKIVDQLRAAGETVKDEDIARTGRCSMPISSPTECTTFRAANGTIDTAFNMLE